MSKYSIYKAVLRMLIILAVLTTLCLLWVEPNTAPFYVSVITLAINLITIIFIVARLVVAYIKGQRLDAEEFKLRK